MGEGVGWGGQAGVYRCVGGGRSAPGVVGENNGVTADQTSGKNNANSQEGSTVKYHCSLLTERRGLAPFDESAWI